MCRCNNICSLFQAESVIMTFQFHLENIPFFRCLHKLLPLHNKTLRNSQQAGSGSACSEWYCWCNVMVRLQYQSTYWAVSESTVAGTGYHDPILSHGGGDMGTGVIQGEHIRPDRPSCNLNNRDKITGQADDWSSSLLHRITTHLVPHYLTLHWLPGDLTRSVSHD